MPVDVAAEVIVNRALSADYNLVALAAPAIAAAAAPGQFVMLKANAGFDPLLRRPFSIFEILRDGGGTPSALTILSKRIGPSTNLLYDARAGQRIACLRPLGRPFTIVAAPVERVMGCGLGGCYSCVVPMRGEDGGRHHVRSCIAGPVLAADQIIWD